MKRIFVTQRVTHIAEYGERRDCLDQNWGRFLGACGALPIAVPNDKSLLGLLVEDLAPDGVVFTGGNDLVSLGGDAPERDEAEFFLLDWARAKACPAIGVCRGMQIIQSASGVMLERVTGHVTKHQDVETDCGRQSVNSYHNFGAYGTSEDLSVWAKAGDGVVEAVRHSADPVLGVMWHPERFEPFRKEDISLFKKHFDL